MAHDIVHYSCNTRCDSRSNAQAQHYVYFASRRADPPVFWHNIFENDVRSARVPNLVYSVLDRLRMVNRDGAVPGDLRFAGRHTPIAQSATVAAGESENEVAKIDN